MTVSPGVWYQRISRTDDGWWRVAAYENDQHADGDLHFLAVRPALARALAVRDENRALHAWCRPA